MKFSTVSLVAFASTATAAGYGQYPNPDQPEFYPTRQVTLTPTGAASSTVDGDQPQSYPTEQATSTVDGDEPQYYPTEQATSTVDGDEPQYYPTQKSTSTVDGDEPQYYPTKPATSTVDGDRPQKTHHVDVGTFDGEFKFVPNQVDAPVGDVVVFNFLKQSHSLTQSDFKTPCTYNGGFDTGLNQVNPKNESGLFEIPLEVTDTKPQWFYCKQQGPPNHCGKGMVFGLNPAGKMDQFVQNAIEQNGEKPDDPAEDPNEYPPEDPNEDPNEYPADDPSEDPNEYPTEDPNEDPNNGSQDKPNKGFWYFWVKAWRYGWHGKGDKGWNHGKPNEGTCPAPQTVTETATVTATVTYTVPDTTTTTIVEPTPIQTAPDTTTLSTTTIVEPTPIQTAPDTTTLSTTTIVEPAPIQTVTVGLEKGTILRFDPEFIPKVVPGSKVRFDFRALNHTLTESTFDNPCAKLQEQDAIDSNFLHANPDDIPGAKTFDVVFDSDKPRYFYCKQGLRTPNSHCGKGMVFAINVDGDRFNSFKDNAAATLPKIRGRGP